MTTEQVTNSTALLHLTSCPTCKSTKYIKNGKENGNQRYRCKKCGKGFRSTTETSIHRLHLKSKIPTYLQCMNEGLSLRKAAQKTGISLATAFSWRHKLLKGLRQKPQRQMTKKIYATALNLPFSHKGRPATKSKMQNVTSILITDSTGQINLNILGKYGNSSEQIITSFPNITTHIANKHLPHLFKTGSSSIISKAETKNIQQIHLTITNWLNKFRGVATKYLQNYWAWYSVENEFELKTDSNKQLFNLCI